MRKCVASAGPQTLYMKNAFLFDDHFANNHKNPRVARHITTKMVVLILLKDKGKAMLIDGSEV